MPANGTVTLNDLVMGDVTFDYANVDDPILVKADADRSSTYHLAAMYDDHAMGVTHIVRSTEWLPSTPKHLWLFQVSGWALPYFAHVPNVNDDSGKKLSKRKGAPSMFDFRDKGYLPGAVMNYMALLGWNPGGGDEQNIFTKHELQEKFDLHRVGSSPAIFSYPKLDWLNAQHIRRLPEDELVRQLKPALQRAGISINTPQREAQLRVLVPHILPRLNTLNDAAALVDFVFGGIDTPSQDALIGPKMELHLSRHALTAARDVLAQQTFDDETTLEAVLRDLCTELNLKPNQLFTIIRNAVSNKTVTPPLFGVLRALGKATSLTRLDSAIKQMGG
jgi:glutamyl-tRNA synthetase